MTAPARSAESAWRHDRKLENEIASLRDDLARARIQTTNAEQSRTALLTELTRTRTELAHVLEALADARADHEAEVKRLRADRKVVDRDITKAEETIRRMQADLTKATETASRLQVELAAATKRIDRARAALGTETP